MPTSNEIERTEQERAEADRGASRRRGGAASVSPPEPATTGVFEERASEPTPEQIAQRAYELYLERGGIDGYDREDWLRAEEELRKARR
jgi:hypothetical protein